MDFIWRRNAPDPEAFALVSDDGVTPVDLSGIALRMQLRLYAGAPGPALVTLTMAGVGAPGFVIDDAASGQFTITPPISATLLALPRGGDDAGEAFALAFDILLVHPDGVVEPFIEGRVLLPEGVSR